MLKENKPVHFLVNNRLPNTERKKIVLIGGMGTIGKILERAFAHSYEVSVIDIIEQPVETKNKDYTVADVTNVDDLMTAIPADAAALVNLCALPAQPPMPDKKGILLSSSVYVVGAYNVLLAAANKGIRKVVLASTNHVTGAYEAGGQSSLGRQIRATDYPLPDSAYGAMKLCAELFGYLFYKNNDISVICLRIGTVAESEVSLLRSDERACRTLMSKRDTVEIFRKALETQIKYGVYYAVSDNPGNPWDLSKAIHELGFRPQTNSQELLKEKNKRK